MNILLNEGNYEGSRVILACPSVGNVSQLAVDLLISSLKAIKIGSVWHPALLPFIGADPFDSKSTKPCTSCDIYHSKEQNLLLVQLRAPLCENQSNFLKQLVEWFQKLGVSELVVLSGAFSVGHYDEDVKYGSFRFVSCPLSSKNNSSVFDSLDWLRMKENTEENKFTCPALSGAGFARRLFNICVKSNLPVTILLHFCLEGDNVLDGVNLLKRTNDWFKYFSDIDKQMIIPTSWNYLFGNSTPDMMY